MIARELWWMNQFLSMSSFHHGSPCTNIITWRMNSRPLVAAVQRHSLTHINMLIIIIMMMMMLIKLTVVKDLKLIVMNDICYVLYSQGCFLNNIGCYDQPKCVETREEPKKALMFCCCEGDMCNQNFTWEPVSTHSPPSRKFLCCNFTFRMVIV
jgi:hypothetical protein